MLGGAQQDPYARSKFINVKTNTDSPFVLVDLTEAYKDHSKQSIRGVAMVEGRRAVLVQDEFQIDKICDVVWGMTTDAEIAIGDSRKATLKIGEKKLVATLLAPADAGFSVRSVEQEPPQRKNAGVRRLIVEMPKQSGEVRIAGVVVAGVAGRRGPGCEGRAPVEVVRQH